MVVPMSGDGRGNMVDNFSRDYNYLERNEWIKRGQL